jgi:ornithine--oxo-acid transaminase
MTHTEQNLSLKSEALIAKESNRHIIIILYQSFRKRRRRSCLGCRRKKYYDFLSAYSAVNQGHCQIVSAMIKQAQTLP